MLAFYFGLLLDCSDIDKDVYEAAQVANDFICTKLRFSEDPINECNRHLLNSVAKVLGPCDDLHLEAVASGLDLGHDGLEDLALVQAERSR